MRQKDKDLFARDLGEPVPDADLAAVLEALDAFTVPEPSAARTAALIGQLRAFVPPLPARRRFRETGLADSTAAVLGGLLLAQVRLFRPAWWLQTGLVALLWPFVATAAGVPVALLAPPLVAAGITYAFRETASPAAEIELSCQVRPAHLALARVLLVMAWTLALGPVTVAVLGLAGHEVPLFGTMLTWSAGMLCFGGATLALTLWAGPRGALGVGLVAWVALALRQTLADVRSPILGLSDGTAALAGLALALLSLILAGRLFRLPREEA